MQFIIIFQEGGITVIIVNEKKERSKKGSVTMIGRNDPCPCGSGKKYKKCCEGKQQLTAENVFQEEIENILQTFYNSYPERKDVKQYFELVQHWMPKLQKTLQKELIEAVALDDFFFHKRRDIWKGYLKKVIKKSVRPQTIALLKQWDNPIMFIGEVTNVEDKYFTAEGTLTGKKVKVRRENQKPIPLGMRIFSFLLPDGSGKEDHMLAASTLIFFPADHAHVFTNIKKIFDAQKEKDEQKFLANNHLEFWCGLVEAGYAGEEFTTFEQDVLEQTKQFLNEQQIEGTALIQMLEDYLVEMKPKARKAGAVAAGAIRFAQDKSLLGEKSFTVKQLSEYFGISPSSLNKYYQELLSYTEAA